MTTYIAGPMTGYPEYNYPLFQRVTDELRTQGCTVVSPHELHDGRTDLEWTFYLRHALKAMLDCDEVITLPGWVYSRGATLEVHVARALNMKVTHWKENS